jgi:hypothetical protein
VLHGDVAGLDLYDSFDVRYDDFVVNRSVPLAPPASSTFLIKQTSHQQSTNNLIEQISHRQIILLSEQISNNHQPA